MQASWSNVTLDAHRLKHNYHSNNVACLPVSGHVHMQAIKEEYEIVVCDTSGRLHTNAQLMEELAKCKRAIGKRLPGAPHETLLVLDGTTGDESIITHMLMHWHHTLVWDTTASGPQASHTIQCMGLCISIAMATASAPKAVLLSGHACTCCVSYCAADQGPIKSSQSVSAAGYCPITCLHVDPLFQIWQCCCDMNSEALRCCASV